MNDSKPTIPLNDEHIEAEAEARQHEINVKRAEMKTKMTPTEVARLDVIEECSAKLEAAGIPFWLWAASDDGKLDNWGRSWWCFHRLIYTEALKDSRKYGEQWLEAAMSLITPMLTHTSIWLRGGSIVTYSPASNPMSVHKNGEHQFIPPPLPPSDPAIS